MRGHGMTRTINLPILLFVSLLLINYHSVKAQDEGLPTDQRLINLLWSGDPETRKNALSKISIEKAFDLMRHLVIEDESHDYFHRTTARQALAAIRDELGQRKEAIQPVMEQFRSLTQRYNEK